MIAPSIGDLFTNSLGDGGWVYGPAVRRQQKQQTKSAGRPPNATPPTVFNLFAVRYAPGVSPTAAFASLRRQFGATVLRQLPSEDVINLQSVDGLPAVLAGLVLLLGVATVGNSLITSVRRRRRDFAILKTIGFTPRQVARVVAWQATIVLPRRFGGGHSAWHRRWKMGMEPGRFQCRVDLSSIGANRRSGADDPGNIGGLQRHGCPSGLGCVTGGPVEGDA